MSPGTDRPNKPRRYSGAVPFLDAAADHADTWTDAVLTGVKAHFPYPPERGVRTQDWVELVAHVSLGRQEDPVQCAERLALYCHTYAERYQKHPLPDTIARSQEHGD